RTAGVRAGRPGSRGPSAAGSKKERAACVATTLAWWPRRRRSSYSKGVLTAATEPVTPSRTLAMVPLAQELFEPLEESGGQVAPADTLVASRAGAEEGVVAGAFQGVGHHQLRSRVPPRALGDLEQPGV